jgi:hypothetical protein
MVWSELGRLALVGTIWMEQQMFAVQTAEVRER